MKKKVEETPMSKVKIIPCSGIEKVKLDRLPWISTKRDRRIIAGRHRTSVSYTHIVTGDEEIVSKIEGQPCITIDGCAKCCAQRVWKPPVERSAVNIVSLTLWKRTGEEHRYGHLSVRGWMEICGWIGAVMADEVKAMKKGDNQMGEQNIELLHAVAKNA